MLKARAKTEVILGDFGLLGNRLLNTEGHQMLLNTYLLANYLKLLPKIYEEIEGSLLLKG